MAKKKEVKKEEYEEVCKEYADTYGKNPLPAGVTHYELEVDYSACYYENDTPSYIIHFFKKIS